MDLSDRFTGALLGLACGDALGASVEFSPRGTFAPLEDMIGGGPFKLRPGEWTDDTSMALCLATSLVATGGFDARDQMNRYCNWQDYGYLSSTGECFDIGRTVADALSRYRATGEALSGSTEPMSAGNGSLMRLVPVVMFYFPDEAQILKWSAESSRTTHGAPECLDACRIFGVLLLRALSGRSKEEILFSPFERIGSSEAILEIARGEYRKKNSSEIRGSGYVVESLEAALWCFSRGNTFEQAVLLAANLGDDADTTAGICGQLAGAHFGAAGIPRSWQEKIVMADQIRHLSESLLQASQARR